MLRKFAAVLLATTLITGTAMAAQSSGSAPTTPAAAATAVPAKAGQATTVKVARHLRKHVRKHIARARFHAMKQARHIKSTKTHQANVSKSHISKAKDVKATGHSA